MKRAVLVLLSLFVVVSDAAAAPKPVSKLTLCIQPDGKLVAKKRCPATDAQATVSNLAGYISPMNPGFCTTRFFNATESLGLVVGQSCQTNEFLLTHGVQLSSPTVYVNQIALLYFPGVNYPQGVEYTLVREGTSLTPFSATVAAVCCAFQ